MGRSRPSSVRQWGQNYDVARGIRSFNPILNVTSSASQGAFSDSTGPQEGWFYLHLGIVILRCGMAKARTTLTIDEEVLRAVKVRAARTGKSDSEVIEEALRRDFGFDLLDRIWARNDMPEVEAMALALEAQHASRSPPKARLSRCACRTRHQRPRQGLGPQLFRSEMIVIRLEDRITGERLGQRP